ncbi:MAG: hypothetical protein JNN18_05570 [Rubrivivax sp.]|nr:hypothetical protein [Rubrivivax sp.]
MLASAFLCSVLAVACGGGGGDDDSSDAGGQRLQALGRLPAMLPPATTEPFVDPAAGAASAPVSAPEPAPVSAPDTASSAPPSSGSTSESTSSAGRGPVGDATTPSTLIGTAANLRTLDDATASADAGTRGIGPTANCQQGFVLPADLATTRAAPLPAHGGIFHTEAEAATWRARTASGPFVADGDWARGSPGDWARIQANARSFRESGEPTASSDESARWGHGHLARDAAFAHLMAPDAKLLAGVREYLLREAAAPQNDFAKLRCVRDAAGAARDGFFAEAPWLVRYIATYDYVRAALPEADRATIEAYVRRNAWFLAAHTDHFLAYLFPARLQGDYTRRTGDAAAIGSAAWVRQRVDTNGNCDIDAGDDPAAYPAYAYTRADGTLGPRVAVLTQWFNNRRATHALAMAAAGVLLADEGLVMRAKRYVMEWLTYAVYPDGSSGEFARNGDYCIAKQGVIYNAMNIQAGLLSARLLARQGDRSLADFSTRDGLFGTESGAAGRPKSLALVAETLLSLSTRALDWYRAEPQRAAQAPREATSLSRMDVNYMGGATAMDDFHELTLLSGAAVVPGVPVVPVLTRERSATTLRWPGSTGLAVVTGAGQWTDAWGVLPAAYLLRP